MNKTTAAAQSMKARLPWLVAIAFFLESMDTTVLNTAMPVISKALAVTPLSIKPVLSSYTLSLAIFIPVSGWMADCQGRQRHRHFRGVSQGARAQVPGGLRRCFCCL